MDRDKLWAIMSSKGLPIHLNTKIRKIYVENFTGVDAGNGVSEDFRVINQGLRKGCSLSLLLFNLYLDEVIGTWLTKLKTSKYFKELNFNTLRGLSKKFVQYVYKNFILQILGYINVVPFKILPI